MSSSCSSPLNVLYHDAINILNTSYQQHDSFYPRSMYLYCEMSSSGLWFDAVNSWLAIFHFSICVCVSTGCMYLAWLLKWWKHQLTCLDIKSLKYMAGKQMGKCCIWRVCTSAGTCCWFPYWNKWNSATWLEKG